jgi:hypothetical protein
MQLIGILGGLSLGFMFTIESATWFIRALAQRSKTGQMIAVSNTFLYSSRLFAFGFQLVISVQIDASFGWNALWGTFASAFIAASALHLLIFFSTWGHTTAWPALLRRGKLALVSNAALLPAARWRIHRRRLFAAVLFSASLFGLSATAPYLLAHLYAGMRMTLGSVAQIINFAGSVMLVYWVDPMLFRLMDEELLGDALFDYLLGRLTAFLLFAVMFIALWIVA